MYVYNDKGSFIKPQSSCESLLKEFEKVWSRANYTKVWLFVWTKIKFIQFN